MAPSDKALKVVGNKVTRVADGGTIEVGAQVQSTSGTLSVVASGGANILLNPSSGLVGIGNAIPTFLLDGYQSQNAPSYFSITNPNGGTGAAAIIQASNNTGTLAQIGVTGSAYAGTLFSANEGFIRVRSGPLTLETDNLNYIRFAPDGYEAVRILPDGYVGIATSAPISFLDIGVDGYANAPVITMGSVADPTTGLWHPTSGNLAVSTGGVEALRINAAQELLLGTTQPYARLSVFGNNNFTTSTGMNALGTGTGNITVGSTSGFPAIGYALVVGGGTGSGIEIVKYSVIDGVTLSITNRAQLGTSAVTFSAGTVQIDWFISLFTTTASSTLPSSFASSGRSMAFPGTSDISSLSIGIGTLAQASRASAFGTQANASGLMSVALGYLSASTGNSSTAVGPSTTASATSALALGNGATASGISAIALGGSATFNTSVQIGRGSTTATNQFVLGGPLYQISESYWGRGVTDAAPVSFLFSATGGSGTDIGGGNLLLSGGKSTGAGLGGQVLISTSPAATSGTSLNASVTRISVTSDGSVGLAMSSAPTSKVHNGGSVAYTTTSVSANTTLDATHHIVRVDASGGNRAITLPAASVSTREYRIKKIDSSANTVTVTPNGVDTIDLAASFILYNQNNAVIIVSDGTSNWNVL